MNNSSESPLPILKNHIGKRGTLKVPVSNKILRFTIKDEVCLPQTNMPQKTLCLQLIEFDKDHAGVIRKEVRVAYYIIGKKPRTRGKWVFGQYATMMPLNDFTELFRQASEKHWFDATN